MSDLFTSKHVSKDGRSISISNMDAQWLLNLILYDLRVIDNLMKLPAELNSMNSIQAAFMEQVYGTNIDPANAAASIRNTFNHIQPYLFWLMVKGNKKQIDKAIAAINDAIEPFVFIEKDEHLLETSWLEEDDD